MCLRRADLRQGREGPLAPHFGAAVLHGGFEVIFVSSTLQNFVVLLSTDANIMTIKSSNLKSFAASVDWSELLLYNFFLIRGCSSSEVCCFTEVAVIWHKLHFNVFGRPFVKRFTLCHQTIVCPVCLWRWCTVAKRLDGSRWNLAST